MPTSQPSRSVAACRGLLRSGVYQTNHLAAGDHASDTAADAYTTTTPSSWLIDAVDVTAPATRGSVVTLGDSITDGYGSSLSIDHR